METTHCFLITEENPSVFGASHIFIDKYVKKAQAQGNLCVG